MKKYIAQLMAIFNWMHWRRWAWILGKDDGDDKT